jgi:hypothetical protein
MQIDIKTLKARVIHAEMLAKTLGVTIASGSALSVHQYLTASSHIEDIFTPAGLLKLKHNFIYGGLISLFGLFVPSPIKSASSVNQPTQ